MKNTLEYNASPPAHTDDAWWFLFHGDTLFLKKNDRQFQLATSSDIPKLGTITPYYLGQYLETACYAAEISDEAAALYQDHLYPVRRVLEQLDEEYFLLTLKIKQLLRWHRHTQFCGRCGHETQPHEKERAKICLACKLTIYPELSPAVIVLIKRDKEILLARSPHFVPGMYSLLAGFVEPGESVEEAIVREIHEEVGLMIHHIEYISSQSWPFPNSLMLGFVADYLSGEIKIDGVEITEAAWYSKDNLPSLPNPTSIARKIIDAQLKKL